ncbi:hypothetical protein BKA69DRAFT_1037653 [Paraphysoderma sedebokerense]|nr:hypothetical protein BKA69DRAFT_1037653 [Paraphysoderma sedebokerense]
MTGSDGHEEKYQRLIQEYSKIKAQNSLLKKAVIDEKSQTEDLEAELKAKEQEIKKSVQQLELLSFHNQNLSKRIENLQQQLKTQQKSSSWFGGGSSTKKELEITRKTMDAVRTELNLKIEENESLHRQLHDNIQEQEDVIISLKTQLAETEKKLAELQEEIAKSALAYEESVSSVKKENHDIKLDLNMTKEQLELARSQILYHETSLLEQNERFFGELKSIRRTLESMLESDTGEESKESTYYEMAKEALTSHLRKRLSSSWKTLSENISTFHENYQTRIQLQISESGELSDKMAQLLHELSEYSGHLKAIQTSIDTFISKVEAVPIAESQQYIQMPAATNVKTSVIKLFQYYTNLFSIISSTIEESPSKSKTNSNSTALSQTLDRLLSAMENVMTYMKNLSHESVTSKNSEDFFNSLSDFTHMVKVFSSHFTQHLNVPKLGPQIESIQTVMSTSLNNICKGLESVQRELGVYVKLQEEIQDGWLALQKMKDAGEDEEVLMSNVHDGLTAIRTIVEAVAVKSKSLEKELKQTKHNAERLLKEKQEVDNVVSQLRGELDIQNGKYVELEKEVKNLKSSAKDKTLKPVVQERATNTAPPPDVSSKETSTDVNGFTDTSASMEITNGENGDQDKHEVEKVEESVESSTATSSTANKKRRKKKKKKGASSTSLIDDEEVSTADTIASDAHVSPISESPVEIADTTAGATAKPNIQMNDAESQTDELISPIQTSKDEMSGTTGIPSEIQIVEKPILKITTAAETQTEPVTFELLSDIRTPTSTGRTTPESVIPSVEYPLDSVDSFRSGEKDLERMPMPLSRSRMATSGSLSSLNSKGPAGNVEVVDTNGDLIGNVISIEYLPRQYFIQWEIPLSKDAVTREALIQKHYETKINQLTRKVQSMDAKAMQYYNAYTNLLTNPQWEKEKEVLVRQHEDEKKKFELMLQNERKNVNALKEQLESVESGYKSQMEMLTEPQTFDP